MSVCSGVARNIFLGEQMVGVWRLEPSVKSRGEAPVVGLGGAPPEGDDSAIKRMCNF